MIIKLQSLLTLSLLFLFVSSSPNYQKVIHNSDPQAKCLDGSPGLLYVHEGTDSNNFLIFFQGGGLCGDETLGKTLQSCYQRSKTILGSSKYWPEELTPQLAQGYLSTDSQINPYANWTKFVFGYCDGALHQGYSNDPIKYKDTELYFRGAAISRSHFKWIFKTYPKILTAQKVILTGGSAGGIAVHLYSNYLRSILPNPESLYSIDDSGVFLNYKTHLGNDKIQKMIENIYKVANTNEATPFTECNQINKGQQWKCLFIQYGYVALKGRYLIINSQYDSWTIPNLLQIKCLKQGKPWITLSSCSQAQLAYIEKYRDSFRTTLVKFLGVNPLAGVWAISCSNHVYACVAPYFDSASQKVPELLGNTVKEAIGKFLNNERVVNVDVQAWPANTACAH